MLRYGGWFFYDQTRGPADCSAGPRVCFIWFYLLFSFVFAVGIKISTSKF